MPAVPDERRVDSRRRGGGADWGRVVQDVAAVSAQVDELLCELGHVLADARSRITALLPEQGEPLGLRIQHLKAPSPPSRVGSH